MKHFFIILLLWLIVDLPYLWLTQSFHAEVFKTVQLSPDFRIRPAAAIIAYLIGASILTWLVTVVPQSDQLWSAFFLGLTVYGLYDWTNYATLSRYPLRMVMQDMLWGSISFGMTVWLWQKRSFLGLPM